MPAKLNDRHLALWGALASIIAIPLALILYFVSKAEPVATPKGASGQERAAEISLPPSPTIEGTQRFPFTIDQVLHTLADAQLTDLQKADFRRRHQDRIVYWEGVVESVSELNEGQEDSPILVIISPISEKEELFHNLVSVSFSGLARRDLLELRKRDIIGFEGKLDFSSSSNQPRIGEARLLRLVR